MEYERYMKLAIREAEESLREGNNGFGAVIANADGVVASAHDLEDTQNDPTSHAEINAIRAAGKKLGKHLRGCTLISTHEPCPMCAFAIVWAGIDIVAYGYSIGDAMAQGRRRIDFPCEKAFRTAGADITVHGGIMRDECAVLYRKDVRAEIERLRDADDSRLALLNADSVRRRTDWFLENKGTFDFSDDDPLESGYRLLLERLRIAPEEAPVVKKTAHRIMFHSMNFCPTLEACRILGLDTRYVCKRLNESSTDLLVKRVDPRLRFSRNYDKLRPYSKYCEEFICLDSDGGGEEA